MDQRIRGLMDYLDASHSVFHAVAGIRTALEEAGYTRLFEKDAWNLVLFQPLVQAFCSIPVAIIKRIVRYHQCFNLDLI